MNQKTNRIFTSFFNYIFFLGCFTIGFAQTTTNTAAKKDSITPIKQKYGIRVGGDASKLVRTFLDNSYSGFEVCGDIRFTKQWYLAAEIGNEKKTTALEFINTTASGSYFKVGSDYNMHQNWLDMENLIYFGLRVGVSRFNQTLNNYSIYSKTHYWDPQYSSNTPLKHDGLSAIWAEVGFGFKAEIANNLYVGISIQLKRMVHEQSPSTFANLYIPGFNKTYDSAKLGAGFGYTISYLIPVLKKEKNSPKTSKKEEKEKENN